MTGSVVGVIEGIGKFLRTATAGQPTVVDDASAVLGNETLKAVGNVGDIVTTDNLGGFSQTPENALGVDRGSVK